MLRSQLKSYSGADPIWGFVSLVGSERFTGEAVLGPAPRVHLYAVEGRVYYAEREGDRPVGARLLAAGSITAAQLDQGTVDVGGTPSLARLFQRQPLIDRDAIELTIEAATEALLEAVADIAAGDVEVFPLRHHPSGIHHWLRSAGATPLPARSMAISTAVAADPPASAEIADESPAPDPTPAADLSTVDGEMAQAPASTEPIADWGDADREPTEAADTEPADAEPADTEPADTEPADTEPADTEPADTGPADTEPALSIADDESPSAADAGDSAVTPDAPQWGESADAADGLDEREVEVATADDADATLSEATLNDATLSDATLSDATLSDASEADHAPTPIGGADLPLVARLAPLPSTDSSHLSGHLSGLPEADELPPLGAVTYLPSSLASGGGQSVFGTGRPALAEPEAIDTRPIETGSAPASDAEVNIFAPDPSAASDDLPRLAAAPIGIDQLMSDQAATTTSSQPSQPNSLAAVEIWEMVDNLTATPAAAPAPTPSADESLARGWRRGTKNKSR